MNGRLASRGRDERGTGTVLAVGVLAVIMALFVVGATAGRYLVASHQARSAADLAALAGAGAYRSGSTVTACAAAGETARRNGARLSHCDVVGDRTDFVVAVRTEVEVGGGIAGLPRAMPARALAGPVSDP